jgi:glycosyltransferase involved in cell wall biosynthesis
MIEGKTIICFASGYDAPPTSKHHVMYLLAEHNQVLWINYHASRVPAASSSDLLYIARKLKQIITGISHPRRNLYVLTPMVVPLPDAVWAKKLNRMLLTIQIRLALFRIFKGTRQIWSFTPDISYMLGQFGEQEVIYYCVDDHAAFSSYNRDQVLRDEEELCRRADLVVTSSLVLQETKRDWNQRTILVPHGVDFDHFFRAVREDLAVPGDIVDIPRPRLGFIGLIRDWVDLEMVAAAADRRPEWHFVLIGDSRVDLGPYRKQANLHFLGRKSYEALPGYCRHFDVGLIPFKVNQLTRAVNPIKLREYLAAGLPVVSTPMPEVQQYDHLIRISDSVDSFVAAIEASLADGPEARLTRSQAMESESWPQKVKTICDALERVGEI